MQYIDSNYVENKKVEARKKRKKNSDMFLASSFYLGV